MMTTADTPIEATAVPIPLGEPEVNRRIMALQEAHRRGLIAYITSRTMPDGRKTYPVLYRGRVYILRPEEVLPVLWAWAEAAGDGSWLAYRDGLCHTDD